MARIKFIITVKTPDGSRIFQTYNYILKEGRICFEDKFGQQKDFPENNCFIEGVEE